MSSASGWFSAAAADMPKRERERPIFGPPQAGPRFSSRYCHCENSLCWLRIGTKTRSCERERETD